MPISDYPSLEKTLRHIHPVVLPPRTEPRERRRRSDTQGCPPLGPRAARRQAPQRPLRPPLQQTVRSWFDQDVTATQNAAEFEGTGVC